MSITDKARIRKNKLDVWQQYLELGKSAYNLGQYAIGEKMLKAAAKESASDEEMCLTLGSAMEEIADGLFRANQHQLTERMYKKSLQIYDRINNSRSNANACSVLYKLAALCISRNRHEVALRYFGKALIVSRRSDCMTNEVHLELLRNLAALWSRKGRHDEALLVHAKTQQLLGN